MVRQRVPEKENSEFNPPIIRLKVLPTCGGVGWICTRIAGILPKLSLYIYVYMYIYKCVCMCVCEGVSDRNRRRPKGVGEGATPIPGLLKVTLDTYLIMQSVRQGGIKYHFWSFCYDSTWDWTPGSRAIDEHSTHSTNDIEYVHWIHINTLSYTFTFKAKKDKGKTTIGDTCIRIYVHKHTKYIRVNTGKILMNRSMNFNKKEIQPSQHKHIINLLKRATKSETRMEQNYIK